MTTWSISRMANDADPYRTLGLARGATLDEVKRAYRRLAKANHPDAAGEAALPRFLAIQAAYDRIAGPGSARDGGPIRRAAARRSWEADPQRADATNGAYAGRARRARASGPASGPRRPDDRPPRPDDRPPRPGAPPRTDEPPTNGRRKRATLGSTSYDEADTDPFEPEWGGSSWYGTTSGTYWTINPKEYADPRKHGPEYQARARRGRRGVPDPATADTGAGTPLGSESPADDAAGQPEDVDSPDPTSTGRPPTPPPTHTTASWWESTAGDPARTPPPPRPAPRRRTAAPGAVPPNEPSLPTMDTLVGWLEADHPGPAVRVGRAVLGWAPIALGIGWLAGELSGCARFAATCDRSTEPATWAIQLVVLAALLLVPALARVAANATTATLAAAIPGALLVAVLGGSNDEAAARPLLGGLLVIAWVAGLAYALARAVRQPRSRRPVS
jgi:curved DNA-binding protein CbpA